MGVNRRVRRWEHEDVLEKLDERLQVMPDAMTTRASTVEHPFGTIKLWMGSRHFVMKTLDNVRTEMSLSVLAYNFRRMISILGVKGLIEAMRAIVISTFSAFLVRFKRGKIGFIYSWLVMPGNIKSVDAKLNAI